MQKKFNFKCFLAKNPSTNMEAPRHIETARMEMPRLETLNLNNLPRVESKQFNHTQLQQNQEEVDSDFEAINPHNSILTYFLRFKFSPVMSNAVFVGSTIVIGIIIFVLLKILEVRKDINSYNSQLAIN